MSRIARRVFAATLAVVSMASLVAGFGPKEARSDLDLLVFISPELRVVEWTRDADELRGSLPSAAAVDDFRAEHGDAWRFTVDTKRGVASLISGGAIPFIPGHANGLDWQDEVPGCRDTACIPAAHVEGLARAFVDRSSDILGVTSAELVLDPAGTMAVGSSVYLLRFGLELGGVPVDGASVYFRINGGNLIQVATENVVPTTVDTTPTIDRDTGWAVVLDYLGPLASADDRILDRGSLLLVPVTPVGIDPDDFTGPLGGGLSYKLAWRYDFIRPGVVGTWEALVDAHTGEVLRFVDRNRYGRIHGGAYPGDNHVGEADRPFPFVDTGLPAPHQYTDAGGLFPGDAATATLQGKYARINDSCGAISNTTTTGDVDFSLGPGTDCDVPPGNAGGPGNTHSARTQYYHLTAANLRAQGWLPGLAWLQNSFITVNTNQSPWCNATSGGDTLNFYRADSGCWNLGEIPGVAVHEWGHSLDDFDGSGGASTPVETYADWMAALHLRDSCVGGGFYLSGTCGGYGDPCLDCSGIRDIDYMRHQAATPWTAANYGTVWSGCDGGWYYGPCNLEDHCESGISSQALWDFVNRKLTAPPHSMDLRSAWLLADRLWYGGIATLGADMYSCSRPSSNGCSGSNLFQVMLALDDDGDGLANGTPHAAAIYAALADHNIACGNPGDPGNQSFSSCPALAAPVLDGDGGNNSATLSWTAVPGATRYWLYRSDIGCDAGFTRIAEVSGATSSVDTEVVNGITYVYLVQAVAASDSCAGLVSNCESVLPVPCETPSQPPGLSAAAAGDNRIELAWSPAGPVASTYNVYRAIGTCPQTDYQLVASGLTGTAWADDPVSGQVAYAYVVTALDVTGGCESDRSDCAQAQTTGACTQAPTFAGLETVTNPAASVCTLDLAWSPAQIHCTGPAAYDVFRSTDPAFVPGPANRIATGLVGTSFSDTTGLSSFTEVSYVVRAADAGNSSGEDNTVRVSGAPTGPITIGTWTDDAGDTGDPKLATESPWTAAAGQGRTGAGYATGTYTNHLCAALTTPSLLLGSGSTLSFWSKYQIENSWDKGVVEISDDGGSSWAKVPVNYPGSSTNTSDECDLPTGAYFTGSGTPTWAQYSASLAAWDGQEVLLRWRLSTDTSVTYAGWWVDDIAITEVAVPGTCDAEPPMFGDGFESGTTGAWSLVAP
ncbi:MAG TPA: hypothetical protein VLB51_13380 [Methylomirabilota bacterium]|nr:hypothetical protein [Methylomirabilota bacterium]